MSVLSVAPYFPFAGVLPVRQSVQQVGTSTHSLITFATNQATRPACSGCGQRVEPIHSYHVRRVRDSSLAQARVDLDIPHRKVRCPDCGIRIEAHVFLDPFRRSTRRFEQAVEDLCRYLPIKRVAEHFGLSWHTVKEIDKRRLLREVGTPCYDGLRLLAIDEISVHKGHRYMTTVLDFETGRLVWMGEDRSKKTIERFLGELSDDQLASIEAFALDMSGAYRHALQQMCSHAALVYDCFHVVARYGREVIDRVHSLTAGTGHASAGGLPQAHAEGRVDRVFEVEAVLSLLHDVLHPLPRLRVVVAPLVLDDENPLAQTAVKLLYLCPQPIEQHLLGLVLDRTLSLGDELDRFDRLVRGLKLVDRHRLLPIAPEG